MFYLNICIQCICFLCKMHPYPILRHVFMCVLSQTVCTSKTIKNHPLSFPYQTSCGLLCQFMFNWTDRIQTVKTGCVCLSKKLHIYSVKHAERWRGKKGVRQEREGESPHFSSAPDCCIKHTHTHTHFLPLSPSCESMSQTGTPESYLKRQYD